MDLHREEFSKMKKLLSILLSFCVIFSIVGCNNNESEHLKRLEVQRQEIEKHFAMVLSDYKIALPTNVVVSDSDNMVYGISSEIVIDGIDYEQAKQEAVQIIKKLRASDMPYKVDNYNIYIVNSENNVLAAVSYTAKYDRWYPDEDTEEDDTDNVDNAVDINNAEEQ